MALLKPYFDLNIEQPVGDPIIIPLRFKDSAGDPVDISAWDFWLTIKANYTDADSAALARLVPGDAGIVKSKDPSTLANENRVDLVIESAALASAVLDQEYYLDIQVDPGDSRPHTYAKGTYKPTWQATEATP